MTSCLHLQRYAPSQLSRWPLWLKLPRHMASNRLTACSSRCGRVSERTGKVFFPNSSLLSSQRLAIQPFLLTALQRQRSGRVLESDRLPHPTHGRWIRELLHSWSHVDPHSRIPVSWRGNEKDCLEGKVCCLFVFFGLFGINLHRNCINRKDNC